MHDEYTTIKKKSTAEIKVIGSRFLATAFPIASKHDAEQYLAAVRKEFWDATHNCFAYRMGVEGSQFRFNDDGEPGGSAGKPILASIDKLALTDVLVVVTRYFGGTKLGVGGLVRAYAQAADQALTNAEKLVKYMTQLLVATFPHNQISNVMHVISRHGAQIVDTVYDEEVHVTLEIRLSRVEELRAALVNHTSGNIAFKPSPTQHA
ncbi:MAG: YigZ family protein [Ignavibacteriae bacterium]|nr:YigZ family protein [Ignavibacteriota bacterium]